MAKVIRLKPLVWQNTKDGVLSTFVGAEITAFRNAHGKYTACISVPGKRPEMETAFDRKRKERSRNHLCKVFQ